MNRERVQALFDPARSLGLYIVGTAALTVLISALYDGVHERFGWWGTLALAAVLFAVALSSLLYPSLRRFRAGRPQVHDDRRPRPAMGLILLVSPQPGTSEAAIAFHRETLRVCWLIATPNSLAIARDLERRFQGRVPSIRLGTDYLVDADSANRSYRMVLRILEEEAPALDLAREELIADVTGGTKPMTAGMTIACLAAGARMQYMLAERKPDGSPDPAQPVAPIEIEIDRGWPLPTPD